MVILTTCNNLYRFQDKVNMLIAIQLILIMIPTTKVTIFQNLILYFDYSQLRLIQTNH